MIWTASIRMGKPIFAFITSKRLFARVQSLVGSKLARLDERFVAARVIAAIGSLARVNPLVSLEGLFSGKRALTEATPDWTLGLNALLDKRRDFLELGPASFLYIFHPIFGALEITE